MTSKKVQGCTSFAMTIQGSGRCVTHHLSPVEVYSAGDLWLHKHERRTGPAVTSPGALPNH
eukprot:scaffold7729_cov109-Cylindrotheca_fusiformis.AAC.1